MTNSDPNIHQTTGYRVESGSIVPGEGELDYGVTTDNKQGLLIFKNGKSIFNVSGTSIEDVGRNIPMGDSGTPAKIINAKKGDIVLQAENGDIVLKGRNIRIEGIDGLDGGEITITASKIVSSNAPVVSMTGTNVSLIASQTARMMGATNELVSSAGTSEISITDVEKSSIMGKILAVLKNPAIIKFFYPL